MYKKVSAFVKIIALAIVISYFTVSMDTRGAPMPYDYVAFNGNTYPLYPYVGNNIALLVPSADLDEFTINNILNTLDDAYSYYAFATGREPIPYFIFEGRATIAVVPETCGAGCGFLGYTGIELQTNTFNDLYNGVKDSDIYDQAVFYEFGRNFWFFDQIAYVPPDDGGSVVTGYAVFMRFKAMEAANAVGAPFNGHAFEYFKSEVAGMIDRYLADTSLNWSNTLKIGQAPANPLGLGASDLFASFMFKLEEMFGESFTEQMWKEVSLRSVKTVTQDAIDNLVIAASITANLNLSSLFVDEWRWPVSLNAMSELDNLNLPSPYTYTSIYGQTHDLYAYAGEHIALLTPPVNLDSTKVWEIVDSFDKAYEFFVLATGKHPTPLLTYNGLLTIASVPNTCGAGCAYVGSTGLELLDSYFYLLYDNVKNYDLYDQIVFFELGFNFWFFDQHVSYTSPDSTDVTRTGYAVYMRFKSMDYAGVTGGPFNGYSFTYFESEVRNMINLYLADNSLNWSNTLRIDTAPTNPIGLGGADLFASFLFTLEDMFGQEFVTKLWKDVNKRAFQINSQDAIDNLVIAASITAQTNLVSLFVDEWRWPLSTEARVYIDTILPIIDNMIMNGGFEDSGTNNKLADNWTGQNLFQDRRRCNKDRDGDGVIDKFFSFNGDCMWQFKGFAGINSRIRQNVDISTVQIGDQLALSAWIKAKRLTPGGTVKVIVKYTDGTVSKATIRPDTGSYPYTPYVKYLDVTKEVAKIIVQAQMRSNSGQMWLDDVSVMAFTPDAAFVGEEVPLPLAPEELGFRGRN